VEGIVLGVDVGTSATRVSAVAPDGSLLGSGGAEYETMRPAPRMAEQDPRAWSDAFAVALARALAAAGERSGPPTAVGLCGQTPTVVLVDHAGAPVRPALTWQDTRAGEEARELEEKLGDPESLIGTTLPWSAANTPAKLLWLARHEPESRARTALVLQPKDVVGYELTGNAVSDPWSSKGLCRVTDGRAAEEVLDACGWPVSVCPETAPAWEPRGQVSAAAADRFGLPAGIPVAVGWSDALTQVLAAGCFERGSAFVFSGTSSIVGAPVADGRLRAPGLYIVPEGCAPAPLLYGPTQSGGASLEWVCRLLGCTAAEAAKLAADASGGLPTFVPYLAGERTPVWDGDVRAVFLGLSEAHGRAEIAAAVLAGVFLAARHVLDIVARASGTPIGEVEIVGRGVGSLAWEAAALGTLGAALRFHEDADLSARGAAMLAAVAAGAGLNAVAGRLSDRVRRAAPSPQEVATAGTLFADYLAASAIALSWRERSR
jgi:xylulokinase